MRRTPQTASRLRRTLLSGAALGTAMAVGFGGIIAAPAMAAPSGSQTGTGYNHATLTPTLTVSPGYDLAPEGNTTLTLTGRGYATTNQWGQNFGGAYLLFGVISPKDSADPGSWAPTKQGISGINYDYAAGAGIYQSLVNYPGNTTEPGLGFMDQDGDWSEQLTIPGARFTSQAGNQIDCYVQQCGVITIGAHGAQSSGVEVFTPVSFESPVAPAVETSTALGAASPASNVAKGADVTLTATVTPADAGGSVEFLADEIVVGSAPVDSGTARLVTGGLPAGLSTLSARFVPADAADFEPSASPASPARTVRVVDLERIVPDIVLGDEVTAVSGAELVWSVSNHTATGTSVHKKSVISGDVTLTGAATEAERDFVFTDGTGRIDAEGNTRIEFTGSIQLATRTNDIQRIVLTDPVLYTNAAGDGYITADFSGNRPAGAYSPVEDLTIAVFRAGSGSTEGSVTSFTATPVFDGQTAAGTWNGSYTASFPNEFVTLIDTAIRSDFFQGGTTAAHLSKAPRAIQASFETEAPAPEYPEGSAVGTPLSGTTAYIVVTPGEDIDGSGPVTFTLNGYGFNPGPAVAPGAGSGGIYVGFGTKKDTESAETWRRSKGGSSGPVGFGDYTYGAPIFVAHQGTGDGDVADGVMQADGTWTVTATIPGSSLPSFFGDTIDCTLYECGFFSFGAHGAVNAANEAYTAVSFAEPAVPATATTTTLAAQPTGVPVIVGEEVTLSATVAPADAAGTVEFFRGETSFGESTVADGVATLTTTDTAGGAHQLKAVFTPVDEEAFEASASAERTYRFVDLEPAVGGIEVGAAVSAIEGATLNWTIANYVSFNAAPAKSVISGDVVLADLPENPVVADRADQEFVFSQGTGRTDADGDSSVSFEGVVRLTSGTANVWTFADPEVFTNAHGDGYITAEVTTEFLGSVFGMEDDVQGPTRVVVSTFRGAAPVTTDEGATSFEVTPLFEGQVAAGTWAGAFTGATFANQAIVLLDGNIRSFFLQSGAAADASKASRPISLSYTEAEIAAPALLVEPTTGLDRSGAVISVSGSSFEATAKPGYPGAPDAPAGSYVSLGWISNDGWRPSEGNTGSTRVAVITKWVQETQPTDGQYVRWDLDANGRASFLFDLDEVSYAEVLEKKPATGDYRLAVYSLGASGVVQAANELAYDVEFAPAAATTVTVVAQPSTPHPTAFAGEDVALRATVSPAIAGEVEFFIDGVSAGVAEVEAGVADLTTTAFSGGAHQVTASFTPADLLLYAESVSAERTYRIVDLTPVVGEIEVGAVVRQITDAQLEWTIANYVSLGSGPAKSVLGGDVMLAELPEDATATDRANQAFVFSNGTGVEDAAGNRVVSFDGEVRLTSGTVPEWNFREPQVHVNAAGDGYITALVDGVYRGSLFGGEDAPYGPVRVVVSTFQGAETATADGATSFEVAPVYQGQVAAGTWAGEYTGATFANEFLQHIDSGVRSFFFESGTTGANLTKPGLPISLAYVAGVVPTIGAQPVAQSVTEGEDASFEIQVEGTPAPTVQWQMLQDGEWVDIQDGAGTTLVLPAVAASAHGTQYRAVVSNAFGDVISDAVALEVTPVQPTETPAAPTIGDEDEGGFKVVSIDGRTVVVEVPSEHENTWLGVYLHSDPEFLGWHLVSDGRVTVTVPADVYGDHQLSFVAADGEVLGWVSLSLPPAPGGDDDDDDVDGGGSGGSGTDDELGVTGAELPLMATGAALLLLLAGGVLLLARRRQQVGIE